MAQSSVSIRRNNINILEFDDRAIADVYKNMLLDQHKITEAFAKNHFCYLGIEKIYDFYNLKTDEILPEDHRNRATRGKDGWMPAIIPIK